MLHLLKQIVKKYYYPYKFRSHTSPQVQLQQVVLANQINSATNQTINLNNFGFKVFSQFEEDGLILAAATALKITNKTFVEIGSNNCVNSNCANLILHHNWHGLFIDGDETNLNIGKHFYNKVQGPWAVKQKFLNAFVTAENINELLISNGFKETIGFLSIDIDGNDYWVWNAINCIDPIMVMIETHVEFGNNNIVVPYNPNYIYPGKHPQYHGAAPVAMQKLGKSKGYKLVAANQLGFNQLYVKINADKHNVLPEIEVGSTLTHPKTIESFEKIKPIESWEFVRP